MFATAPSKSWLTWNTASPVPCMLSSANIECSSMSLLSNILKRKCLRDLYMAIIKRWTPNKPPPTTPSLHQPPIKTNGKWDFYGNCKFLTLLSGVQEFGREPQSWQHCTFTSAITTPQSTGPIALMGLHFGANLLGGRICWLFSHSLESSVAQRSRAHEGVIICRSTVPHLTFSRP